MRISMLIALISLGCGGGDDVSVDIKATAADCTWYLDADGDTYGNLLSAAAACSMPAGYVEGSTDCDDTDPLSGEPILWYPDADGDGIGGTAVLGPMCSAPDPTYVKSDGVSDCDDNDVAVYPGAPEICLDGVDQNCDGLDGCTLWNDGFESGTLDAALWNPAAGSVVLGSDPTAAGAWALSLGDGNATLSSLAVDSSTCVGGIGWFFLSQRGPSTPQFGDTLFFEWFDGIDWRTSHQWTGDGLPDSGFTPHEGVIVSSDALHGLLRVRLRTSGGPDFAFWVDNFAVDCL